MERLKAELIEFFLKFGSWILGITIGVAAKLAFESRTKVLTNKEKIIKVIISAFVGYLAALYWDYRGWQETIKIAVPVCTLVGESAVEFLMENGKTILRAIFKKNFDIDTKDK